MDRATTTGVTGRALTRLVLPLWQPRWWLADLLKLGWLWRPYAATCVLLRKR